MAASPPENNDVNGITLDQPYTDASGGKGDRKGAEAPARGLLTKVNVLTGLIVFVFLQLIALWILTFVFNPPPSIHFTYRTPSTGCLTISRKNP